MLAATGHGHRLANRGECAVQHAVARVRVGRFLQGLANAGGGVQALSMKRSTAPAKVSARKSSACSRVRLKYRS